MRVSLMLRTCIAKTLLQDQSQYSTRRFSIFLNVNQTHRTTSNLSVGYISGLPSSTGPLPYLIVRLVHGSLRLNSLIFSFTGCNFLKYVTLFSCDTFGFYVSWVYLQYGIQVLTRQFVPISSPGAQGVLVSIILALLMLVTAFLFQFLSETPYFHRHVRRFLADYGMPISLIACSAMAYWGRFDAANPLTLPVGGAFQAAGGRNWLVKFWELEGKWVGIALPFGIVLWILFFFDHNVSVSIVTPLDYSQLATYTRSKSISLLWLKDPNFH